MCILYKFHVCFLSSAQCAQKPMQKSVHIDKKISLIVLTMVKNETKLSYFAYY